VMINSIWWSFTERTDCDSELDIVQCYKREECDNELDILECYRRESV
jgi:hypothetical protein